MDNQTPQNISRTSSGHENHGVHVCPKCRWPFPNPHPSAKHRRSHKKVCGTIEGYKLAGVDSEGTAPKLCVSYDEPSPKTQGDLATDEAKVSVPSDAPEIRSADRDTIVVSEAPGHVAENILAKHSEDASEFVGPKSSTVNSGSDSRTEDAVQLHDSSCGTASSEDSEPIIKPEAQKDSSAKQGTLVDGKNESRSDNSFGSASSDDLAEKKELVDENVHVLSVPSDLHETYNAEIMLEDFKDHKVRPNHLVASGLEIAKEREAETEDLLPKNVLLKELPAEEEPKLNEQKGPEEIDIGILVSPHRGNESSDLFDEASEGHLSSDHITQGVNEADNAEIPSPKKLSELESGQETELQSVGDCGTTEIEKHKITSDSGSKQEGFSENAVVLEPGTVISEPSIDHATKTRNDTLENACTESRSIVPENDLVDSSSRTDSLENNWGSVSVISAQSAAQALIDATESQSAMGERTNSKLSKLSSESHGSNKSDMVEPPSFMTLVEPRSVDAGQNPGPAEIQTPQNPNQPSPSALKAGWFPSITDVVNESRGRKKNAEIIAKVTNWSVAEKQQHPPLKSLLGEASQYAKAKSPKRRESQTPTAMKLNSVLAAGSPTAQTVEKEIGKESNSPAKYLTEIKREKRKPKSRPYWAQFMCCSSVH